MSENSGFDRFVDITNREISLLFQRLNYFLVGSAFLVTAYATLIASSRGGLDDLQLNLAYMINLAGFYLSLLFAFINYLNTQIIWNKDDKIRKLEEGPDGERKYFKAFTESRNIVIGIYDKKELGNNHLLIFGTMIKEAIDFTYDAKGTSKKGLAPHTYIIPLGFWILWAILYFLVLSPESWVYTFFFFLPIVCWTLFFTYKAYKDPDNTLKGITGAIIYSLSKLFQLIRIIIGILFQIIKYIYKWD